MIRVALKISRAARTSGLGLLSHRPSLLSPPPPTSSRSIHDEDGSCVTPLPIQMIDYSISHARNKKSDESYAEGLLVLEQCLSTHLNDGEETARQNLRAMVLLAMSTLLSERGNYDEAIEKLQKIQDLTRSSLGVQLAAVEALVGLHLELGQDDTSSVLADKCLQRLRNNGSGYGSEVLNGRAKAVKGLVQLVHGNLQAVDLLFEGVPYSKCCIGNVALSCGEFLHATRNFSNAKQLYKKVIEEMVRFINFSDPCALACNMSSEEVLLAATCALGQLEAHMGADAPSCIHPWLRWRKSLRMITHMVAAGESQRACVEMEERNFGDAEEILTRALTKTEEQFGSHHPKVGVVLTCIALMFRQKAVRERSSALLIQEGLYRRAIDLLKAPPLENGGGYADVLCVQENRKDEGDRVKSWAESAWRNRRMTLAEALEISETCSKVPVIDTRIGRVL